MARANKVDGIIGVTFSDVEEYLDDTLAFVSIERRFRKIFRVSGDNYHRDGTYGRESARRGATNLLLMQTIMSVDNECEETWFLAIL